MTEKELQEILEKHRLWLYGDKGGERADLTYADLTYADLTGTYLERADLRGADLRHANLECADLTDANLENADLRLVSLQRADLGGANLKGANLSGVNLEGTFLDSANLRGANLKGTIPEDAECTPSRGNIVSPMKMKNILILVDMQNGFTRKPQTKDLVKKIKGLLSLNLFDTVVATQFMNYDNSVYEKLMDWKLFKNDEDRAIRDELMPYIDEIIPKSIYTCVSSNFIQRICQLNDGEYPEKLFVAGVDTDCCVLKIAVDLFENNIRPIVLTNYCHSNGGEEFHNSGILCMKRLIGSKQITDITLGDGMDISLL